MTRRRLLATLCAIPVWSWGADGPRQSAAAATAHWGRVLQKYVNDRGQVDFCGLSVDMADLNAYAGYIAGVSPRRALTEFPSRNDAVAYYINTYNALSMLNVIESGIPKELGFLTRVWFFGFRRFKIGGESMSLYTYENSVIRPMGDERVHFALNCMSAGCPRLPRQPFSGPELDRQLDNAARYFFSESRNLQIDHANRVIRVSSILKFYTDDFLKHNATLIAYINRYAPLKVPENSRIEFIPYDWTIYAQDHRCHADN
ncbi:hypothetical protein AQ477_18275 (plasmid) [Burkholderia thailandensis]|nr:hypothetical protein AQ477_18275 [Burkholderia thailandensis]KXF59812.1 hypothetical protein AQ476_18040 [Burkholderia thailandensis]PNE76468.1 DUF547 domain-containing protein [Burkholderia thailandensis]